MAPLFPDEDVFSTYLTQTYGISSGEFSDGAICYAGGVEAGVLVFSDEAAAKAAEDTLLEYIGVRTDSFTGYVPDAVLGEGFAVSYSGGSSLAGDITNWLANNRIKSN